MSQKNLQPGDICWVVGFKPGMIGYPHNNTVVILVERSVGVIKETGEKVPGWRTDPPIYAKGYVKPVSIDDEHLKPFPKDLLKDEEVHKEELTA